MGSIASFEEVSYKNSGYNVVDDVTFMLERGAITTLIGPNGAGKSTIAKLLLGIRKQSAGKIERDISNYSYVPQKLDFNKELPLNSVKLMDLLSPNYKKNPFASDLIYFANIDKLSNRSLHDLSGGELQRIIIASAILRNPELLVLDEPTQYLDVDAQEEFYSILQKIKEHNNTSIFLISHDLFTVMKKSDQVLCLNHHLCCKGKPTHTVVKGSKNIGIYSHHHDHSHR